MNVTFKPPPAEVTFPSEAVTALTLPCTLSDRYRRSYDSEFTAPLVMYHVWPALMGGGEVVAKGEAVTKRSSLVLRKEF